MRMLSKLLQSSLPKNDIMGADLTVTGPLYKDGTHNRMVRQGTVVAGWITGSTITAEFDGGWGWYDFLLEVSIDGSAFASPFHVDLTTHIYTLVRGEEDRERFVVLKVAMAMGDQGYFDDDKVVLSVTGRDPKINQASSIYASDLLKDGMKSFAISRTVDECCSLSSNFLPNAVPSRGYEIDLGTPSDRNWPVIGEAPQCFVLDTDEDYFYVYTQSQYIYYTIDNGSEYTRLDKGEQDTYPFKVDGLPSGSHRYVVWTNCNVLNGVDFTMLFVKSVTPIVGRLPYMVQFGDSITAGAGTVPQTVGEVETMRVASALGYIPGISATSGELTEDTDVRLQYLIPLLTITPTVDDVAIVAIGRNNVNDWGTVQETSYLSIVTQLLAAGFGTVICRSVLPDELTGDFTTVNLRIKAILEGYADDRVKYVESNGWTVATVEGTHPTYQGYDQLTVLCINAYLTAIGQ